jgi:hypothetical protein
MNYQLLENEIFQYLLKMRKKKMNMNDDLPPYLEHTMISKNKYFS